MGKVSRILFYLILSISFLMVPGPCYSALSSDAELILSKAQLFGDNRFLSMKVEMLINTPSGEKSRGIDLSISNFDNNYRVYMQIISPSFLRKMKFLQHNLKNGSTLQWIATSRGARKITSSKNDERIFDSDFCASDFASIAKSDYQIESFSETIRNESPCYRFELVIIQDGVFVNKKVLFIDHDSYLIREVEYYSDKKLVKRYQVISTQNINGKMFPCESLMKDFSKESYTKLIFKKIEMPDSIPDRLFHYRNL